MKLQKKYAEDSNIENTHNIETIESGKIDLLNFVEPKIQKK